MTTSNQKKAKALVEFHKKNKDARYQKIKQIINKVEKLRMEFPNRTTLSEYIAIELSELESKPVSATTIRRNDTYNGLLVDYLLKVSPEKVKNKIDNSIESSIYARQLQKQVEEKDRQISELKSKLNDSEMLLEKRVKLEYLEKFTANKSKVEQISYANQESFDSLFEMIYSLLSKLGSIEFNVEKGYVHDEAEDKVIMTRKNYPEFFNWLKKKI
ncbi:hypothetical protein [Rheinheimera aquimaris]|uniref:hypothetical protein n=1 Tax=Rheinheimera aquimaris TaxID=412437 RepID=UPI0039E4C45A